MTGRYEAHGFWGNRSESVQQCAHRLVTFLTGLSGCDERFRCWYLKGWSKKAALRKPISYNDINHITAILQSSISRREDTGTIIEELGFSFGMWNGLDDDDGVSIIGSIGMFTKVGILNTVQIELPKELRGLGDVSRMADALQILATSWSPEWAMISSAQSIRLRDFRHSNGVFVDWMLYLDAGKYPLPVLPSFCQVRNINNQGVIIVVQDEPVNAYNSEHVEKANAVKEALAY